MMKLTKQLEAEIRQLYELYWNSYINGDLKTYASLLDTSFKFIGSTEAEPLLNKKDSLKFLAATFEQLKGKAEFRNRKIKIEIKNELILINELCDGYILIGTDWTFYSRFRLSSLLHKKGKKWKFIHQHVSMPDSKAQEGESYGLELIRTENMQLREAVKRRTVELESKNRELEIEAALERVRASTMAMHQSKDLLNVINVVTDQLLLLGFKFNTANFAKIYADGSWDLWLSTPEQAYPDLIHVPYLDHPIFNQLKDKIGKGLDSFTDVYGKGEANKFFRHFFENTIAKNAPESRKQFVLNSKGFARSLFLMKDLWLAISNYEGIPYTQEENAVFKRFAKVFEQAYTRFLDLQKAEAQTKEAQVEAALERVRARSMAMQKSDELAEVVAVLYKQFEELGFGLYQVLVSIYDKKNNIIEWWSRGSADIELPKRNIIPIIDHPFSNDLFEKWRNGVEYYPHVLEGDLKKSWDEYLFTKTDLRHFPQEVKDMMRAIDTVYLSDVFMKYGSLQAAGPAPLPDDKAAILKKFVKVLDHAYTRMKDLQTAELQTREAQVELGLERVRSRAMAMQTSEELNELIGTVFTELTKLDLVLTRCVIWVFDPTTNEPRWWMANSEEPSNPMSFLINYHEHPAYLTFIKEWKNQNVKFVYDLKGQDKVSWDDILFNETELKHLPDVVKNGMRAPERVLLSTSFNNFGGINVASLEPLSEEHFDIMLRFAKVFDLTYTRFNDLKQAEAQAREAEIELALERVRAKTMAMQKPSEFVDVVNVIGQQFVHLGFDIEWANFGAQGLDVADGIDTWNFAVIPGGDPVASRLFIPRFDHPIFNDAIKQLENYRMTGNDFFVMSYGKKEKDRWLDHLFTKTIFKDVPEEYRAIQYAKPGYTTSNLALKDTFLSIGKFDTRTFTDEQHAILRRFGKAFGQAYTRFLDLQKAEAQARESQIQLALERVRARTMAMQRSDELLGVVSTLYEQLNNLQFDSNACNIIIIDKESDNQRYWVSGFTQKLYPESYNVPYFKHPYIDDQLQAWKEGRDYVVIEYSGKMKHEFDKQFFSQTDFKNIPEEVKKIISALPSAKLSTAFFTYGALQIIGPNPLSEENAAILQRFAKVFDQTYTRFLDLQKAEAQTKESQIQLALERVRARTMAMQRSDELPQAANLLFQQIQSLGMPAWSAGYCIWNDDKNSLTAWMSSEGVLQPPFIAPTTEDELFIQMRKGSEQGKSLHVVEMGGEKLVAHYQYMRTLPVVGEILDSIIEAGHPLPTFQIMHHAYFSKGFLLFITYEPVPEAHDIFERFANVFDQTYTRFLDLQKAEAQARESQIQLALERVRARTMAMQRSDELPEAANLLFQQVQSLGAPSWTAGYCIWDEDKKAITLSMSRPWGDIQPSFRAPLDENPTFIRYLEGHYKGVELYIEEISGKALEENYQYLLTLPVVGEQLDSIIAEGHSLPRYEVDHCAYFSKGFLLFITYQQVPELHGVFKRFANVFDQTYTRFLDLQTAEAQARESQIQLALERVRARTMAMQKSEELAETSYLLFQQFKELNEGADQISIGIFDEDEEVMKLYSTFHGNQWDQPARIEYNKHPVYRRMFDAWKAQKKSLVTDLTGAELHDFNKFKLKITGYNVPEDELAKDRWVVYTAYFSNGVLSYASHEPRPKESIQLLERFASVFDGTYTRFLDLQKAEAQARESQIQLALERVRARTMAMQKSDELSETAAVLFKQFQDLGEDLMQMTIGVMNEDERVFDFNVTDWSGSGSQVDRSFKLSIDEPSLISKFYKAWKEQTLSIVVDLTGKELEDWIRYRNETSGITVSSLDTLGRRVITAAVFSKGVIAYSSPIPRPEESRRLLERFAGVFDLTYTRFLDLKQAEAQAKEAKIEAALERVRSRTMAMHQTSELQEVIHTVHKELLNLNLSIDGGSFVVINEDVGPGLRCWGSGGTADTSEEVQVPHFNMSFCTDLINGIKRGPGFFTEEFSQEEKKEYFTKLFQHKPWSDLSREQKKETLSSPGGYTRSVAVSNHTSIFVINHHGKKFTEAENDILKRFAKVFEQTYTRFLDLQKAEAQAKEAQIELALERVRARTMAMHRSEELAETAQVLFHQLQELGGAPDRIAIGVVDEAAGFVNFWTTDQLGSHIDKSFKARLNERTVILKTYEAWKEQKRSLVIDLHGDDLKEWIRFAREEMGIVVKDEQIKDRRVHQLAFFSHGWILVTTHEPQSQETIQILVRFTSVFNLTYRRFLDLQIAEAQAREARIEIALERIRARALAMHKSDELMEVAKVVWEQMILLGQRELESSVVHLYDEDPDHIHSYRTVSINPDSNATLTYGHMAIPKDSCEVVREWLTNFRSDLTEYTIEISGAKQQEWYELLFKLAPDVVNSMRQKGDIHEKRYYRFSKFSGGALLMVLKQEPSEEASYLQRRAAVVFDLAYRRFLDLQKAETQAREAQIEAALERVRSRSLAMHKSDELQEVVNTVFERLTDLNVEMDSCNIAIFKEGTRDYDYWIASHFQKRAASFHMPYVNLSLTRDLIAARERGADFSSTSYSFEEKNEWFDYAFKNTDFKFLSEERKQFILNAPAITVGIAFSKHTGVQVNRYNTKLLTEGEAEILKRFSKVFEQAYIRFLDLEKAEAQGREAQIEAALERVRSGSLAMHKSEELKDVVKVVFENFRSLGLQNIDAVNINIFHEGSRDFDLWLAAPGQDYTTNFHLPYLDHPIANDFFNAVKKRESIHKGIYDYDLKNKYFEYMFEHSDNKHLPEERKKLILSGRGYSVATGIAKHSSIFIHNYNGEAFSEEANGILVRFSKVFDQAYTRFLDLQKAEAQAREAQIEASLERVRSKTMAMHNSNDVGETVATMFDELVKLGVETVRCGIAIIDLSQTMEVWTASSKEDGSVKLIIGQLDMRTHPLFMQVFDAWKNKESVTTYELIGEDLKSYFRNINNSPDYPIRYDIETLPYRQSNTAFMFPEGSLFVFSQEPLVTETTQIFKRFAGVFGQTYRRYLDLQRAEAQAREAQIEASLERVRAKAMAMHKSEDLHTAVATVFEELDRLKLGLIRCGIAILDKKEPRGDIWITIKSDKGSTVQVAGDEPLDIHPLLRGAYDAWLKQEDFSYVLKDEDMEDYYKAITKTNFQSTITSTFDIERKDQQQFYFNAVFQDGSLFAFLDTAFTDEAKLVMKRFANVFNLTYKRFLDLQKAEASAREAQIEAGLERVRARTMAMHSSEDVSTATATMFTELEKLGIENLRGGITIIKPDQTQEVWSITNLPDGRTIRAIGVFDMRLHPLWRALFKAKENKEGYDYYWLAGKEKEDYITILNATPNYLTQPIKEIPDVHVQSYFFGEGGVWTNSLQPHSEEDKQVMKRFASVFSLTFRRYQDLKKAEAQAKEATIEAALEKVRGKAMAMHNSNDLSVTTSMIIGELRKLGISPIRCGVGIIDRETHKGQLYTATTSADGDSLSVVGWVLLKGHPVLENIYEKFVQGEDYFPELTGDSMRAYYEQLLAGLSVPLPDFRDEQKHYGHFFTVSVGCLYTWSDVRYNDDEIKILRRFASIIDLTFRRYFELQKSEANAREAVKQAALDRVRADIASMRSVSDLDRITPLIWNELKTLSIPFIRCGVFIMDEDQQLIHTFLSTPDGKAIAAFHLPYDTPGNISKVIDNWRYKKTYVDHWGEEEFIQFADILMKQGSLTSREQYLKTIPRGGFYLHFLPFLQGMLYVGNTEQLNEEQIELIQHVADAFSTAYARYEDFNKLEAAKQQVENTLTDLKQAQTQLVQSEKMASLGELTAGIAHEIQNPLNFVNNFSEVSKELLDEMKEELATGNGQQAIEIAEDIIQNLEKINHHGKRADAIVKSMLQHSRSSTGKKEPTDINALADEYLRLAYHGLRAKDKSFNAKFDTGFDDSIGKVNIISQDIGRVLVNLINNAFYAVSERKKQASNGYEPTVEVFTKKTDDKIEITVKDNGNGIPKKVLDKIFQPFFTTKPTGQGTGLGLSLAYDIITKGHGGELKVETKEGEGSEFIIQLPAN